MAKKDGFTGNFSKGFGNGYTPQLAGMFETQGSRAIKPLSEKQQQAQAEADFSNFTTAMQQSVEAKLAPYMTPQYSNQSRLEFAQNYLDKDFDPWIDTDAQFANLTPDQKFQLKSQIRTGIMTPLREEFAQLNQNASFWNETKAVAQSGWIATKQTLSHAKNATGQAIDDRIQQNLERAEEATTRLNTAEDRLKSTGTLQQKFLDENQANIDRTLWDAYRAKDLARENLAKEYDANTQWTNSIQNNANDKLDINADIIGTVIDNANAALAKNQQAMANAQQHAEGRAAILAGYEDNRDKLNSAIQQLQAQRTQLDATMADDVENNYFRADINKQKLNELQTEYMNVVAALSRDERLSSATGLARDPEFDQLNGRKQILEQTIKQLQEQMQSDKRAYAQTAWNDKYKNQYAQIDANIKSLTEQRKPIDDAIKRQTDFLNASYADINATAMQAEELTAARDKEVDRLLQERVNITSQASQDMQKAATARAEIDSKIPDEQAKVEAELRNKLRYYQGQRDMINRMTDPDNAAVARAREQFNTEQKRAEERKQLLAARTLERVENVKQADAKAEQQKALLNDIYPFLKEATLRQAEVMRDDPDSLGIWNNRYTGFLLAKTFAEQAPQIAVPVAASLAGAVVAGPLGAKAGLALGGAFMMMGANAQQDIENIVNAPIDVMQKVDAYNNLIAKGFSDMDARYIIAFKNASETAGIAALYGAVTSVFGPEALLAGTVSKTLAKVGVFKAGRRVTNAAKAVILGAPVEGGQEALETMWGNYQYNKITGENRPLTDGALRDAKMGALFGGVVSGLGGFVHTGKAPQVTPTPQQQPPVSVTNTTGQTTLAPELDTALSGLSTAYSNNISARVAGGKKPSVDQETMNGLMTELRTAFTGFDTNSNEYATLRGQVNSLMKQAQQGKITSKATLQGLIDRVNKAKAASTPTQTTANPASAREQRRQAQEQGLDAATLAQRYTEAQAWVDEETFVPTAEQIEALDTLIQNIEQNGSAAAKKMLPQFQRQAEILRGRSNTTPPVAQQTPVAPQTPNAQLTQEQRKAIYDKEGLSFLDAAKATTLLYNANMEHKLGHTVSLTEEEMALLNDVMPKLTRVEQQTNPGLATEAIAQWQATYNELKLQYDREHGGANGTPATNSQQGVNPATNGTESPEQRPAPQAQSQNSKTPAQDVGAAESAGAGGASREGTGETSNSVQNAQPENGRQPPRTDSRPDSGNAANPDAATDTGEGELTSTTEQRDGGNAGTDTIGAEQTGNQPVNTEEQKKKAIQRQKEIRKATEKAIKDQAKEVAAVRKKIPGILKKERVVSMGVNEYRTPDVSSQQAELDFTAACYHRMCRTIELIRQTTSLGAIPELQAWGRSTDTALGIFSPARNTIRIKNLESPTTMAHECLHAYIQSLIYVRKSIHSGTLKKADLDPRLAQAVQDFDAVVEWFSHPLVRQKDGTLKPDMTATRRKTKADNRLEQRGYADPSGKLTIAAEENMTTAFEMYLEGKPLALSPQYEAAITRVFDRMKQVLLDYYKKATAYIQKMAKADKYANEYAAPRMYYYDAAAIPTEVKEYFDHILNGFNDDLLHFADKELNLNARDEADVEYLAAQDRKLMGYVKQNIDCGMKGSEAYAEALRRLENEMLIERMSPAELAAHAEDINSNTYDYVQAQSLVQNVSDENTLHKQYATKSNKEIVDSIVGNDVITKADVDANLLRTEATQDADTVAPVDDSPVTETEIEACIDNIIELCNKDAHETYDFTEDEAFDDWFGVSEVIDQTSGAPLTMYADSTRTQTIQTDDGEVTVQAYGTDEVFSADTRDNRIPVVMAYDAVIDQDYADTPASAKAYNTLKEWYTSGHKADKDVADAITTLSQWGDAVRITVEDGGTVIIPFRGTDTQVRALHQRTDATDFSLPKQAGMVGLRGSVNAVQTDSNSKTKVLRVQNDPNGTQSVQMFSPVTAENLDPTSETAKLYDAIVRRYNANPDKFQFTPHELDVLTTEGHDGISIPFQRKGEAPEKILFCLADTENEALYSKTETDAVAQVTADECLDATEKFFSGFNGFNEAEDSKLIAQRQQQDLEGVNRAIYDRRDANAYSRSIELGAAYHGGLFAKYATWGHSLFNDLAQFRRWVIETFPVLKGNWDSHPLIQAATNMAGLYRGAQQEIMSTIYEPLLKHFNDLGKSLGLNEQQTTALRKDIGDVCTALHIFEVSYKQETDLENAVLEAMSMDANTAEEKAAKQRAITEAQKNLDKFRAAQDPDSGILNANEADMQLMGGLTRLGAQRKIEEIQAKYRKMAADTGNTRLEQVASNNFLIENAQRLELANRQLTQFAINKGLYSGEYVNYFGSWRYYTPFTNRDNVSKQETADDLPDRVILSPKLDYARDGMWSPAVDADTAMVYRAEVIARAASQQAFTQEILTAYNRMAEDPNTETRDPFEFSRESGSSNGLTGRIQFRNGMAMIPSDLIFQMRDGRFGKGPKDWADQIFSSRKDTGVVTHLYATVDQTNPDGSLSSKSVGYYLVYDTSNDAPRAMQNRLVAESLRSIFQSHKEGVNPEDVSSTLIRGAEKVLDLGTRFFSNLYTTYNPLFPPINAFRDFQERPFFISTKTYRLADGKTTVSGAGIAAKTVALMANPSFQADLQHAISTNGHTGNAELDAYYTEAANLGLFTTTDFTTLTRREAVTIAEAVGNMSDVLANKVKANAQKLTHKVRRYSERLYTPFPMAQYITMRRAGIRPQDAAFGVTEIMNMRARGQLSRVPLLSKVILFLPSIGQTTINFMGALGLHTATFSGHPQAKQIRRNAIKGWAYLVCGTMISQMLYDMLRIDDDGEDIPEYDQMTLERMNSIPIPLGRDSNGQLQTIDIPLGFSFPQMIWQLGVAFSRLSRDKMSMGDAAIAMLSSYRKNILPGSAPDFGFSRDPQAYILQSFSPIMIRPLVTTMTNRTNFGQRINKGISFHQDARDSDAFSIWTNKGWRELAKEAYDVSGGLFDFTPESWRATSMGYLQGVLRGIFEYIDRNPLNTDPAFNTTRSALSPWQVAIGMSTVVKTHSTVYMGVISKARDYYDGLVRKAGIAEELKAKDGMSKWDTVYNTMLTAGATNEMALDYANLIQLETDLKKINQEYRPLMDKAERAGDGATASYLFNELSRRRSMLYQKVYDNLNYNKPGFVRLDLQGEAIREHLGL